MEILYILLVLLIITRLFSVAAKRMGFPPLLGEIIGGVLLGVVIKWFPDQLPILAGINESEVFHAITELGIFFLMLYAGLELHPKEFRNASGGATWIALGGMVLPLFLGLGLGWYILPESDYKFAQTLFIGVSLAITAVPVAIKLLMDVGELKTRVGKAIVSAAVIDDVVSLLLLAVLTSVISSGEIPGVKELGILSGKIILFFVITILIGRFILPRFLHLVFKKTFIEEVELSVLLITALAFAVLAEAMGMHFIIGAFVAGLFFVRRKITDEIYEGVVAKIKGITTGFLAPVFFASIGLSLDITAMTEIPWIVILLITAATVGKIVGAALPARFLDFSKKEQLMIGFSMNARGAVELIIAGIALEAGLFEQPADSPVVQYLFSAIVIVAIVTTLITPISFRQLLKE